MTEDSLLEPWLVRWRLSPDGAAFVTPHTRSRLQPVRTERGQAAILKVATEPDERRGGSVMVWFGDGVAPVLAHEGDALLLERLEGEGELEAMVEAGRDDEATEILCGVLRGLHRPVESSAPLADLKTWFAALPEMAARRGEEQAGYAEAWEVAKSLFAEDAPATALHGDMHHGNALRSPEGRWLAIDPKGLRGDAGYDFANLLNNPETPVVHAPGRLRRQAEVIARCSGQPLPRLLRWTIAYSALSAAWFAGDGMSDEASWALKIARIAQAELAAIA